MPKDIELIYFVLAAYNHHGLKDATDGNIVLSQSLQECVQVTDKFCK